MQDRAVALVLWLKEFLYLHAWDIYVRVVPRAEMPGGADGFCDCNHRYLTAHISVVDEIDEERLRRVVAHEVCHILFSPIDSMWCTTISLLDRRLRKREEEEKEHVEEQVTQVLSKALVGCMALMEENDGSTAAVRQHMAASDNAEGAGGGRPGNSDGDQ